MEPLNLMVSLSHNIEAKPENKHGLSQPAGGGRRRPRRRWTARTRLLAVVRGLSTVE
ncbi:hypothetical protein AB0L70_27200 [Kribbella sp. NPDC051952]|uniref:hypothetical protein n=1 Tax=Kribbella sp. NPDC051952 TaxID=3154851 RepID=UPI00341C4763